MDRQGQSGMPRVRWGCLRWTGDAHRRLSMLLFLQGCPEEVRDAQDRFGDVQDRLGMLRAPAHSSPR